MAPAAIGLAATQVNIFVNTFLASMLPQGSVSWLNYAYRLMQLPIGLFGVAIATVTLAEVSRHAARREMPELKRTISFSLRFGLFLTLPATMLLIALAHPIVALLYQHGRFGPNDSWETAQALWAYAVGLSAFSAVRGPVPGGGVRAADPGGGPALRLHRWRGGAAVGGGKAVGLDRARLGRENPAPWIWSPIWSGSSPTTRGPTRKRSGPCAEARRPMRFDTCRTSLPRNGSGSGGSRAGSRPSRSGRSGRGTSARHRAERSRRHGWMIRTDRS